MPISRNEVRKICSTDEYDVYCASLRRRLSELNAPELRQYVLRARDLAKPAPAGPKRAGRHGPGKADFLSGALSRLEGRLRTLGGQV